ncbi:phosphotransferase [Gordonia sp. HNM0687]|uniref:Phosphotransferase n=1 Tax=Gordonia mangrovi TaxID=2665643 RepID=A0A6L7GL87_9ACTN|nr:phosphotransferase family protein [Gordonia mangrovi]MXP20011.1 phosphotransferase [Gordonia mangrovi]UVF79373.1 phosphotransferase family protein [Gordonia mangrovi]
MSRSQSNHDVALWRSVQATLEDQIIPVLGPGIERDNARQLTGVARYVLAREADSAERDSGLADTLGMPDAEEAELLSRAADLLVENVTANGSSTDVTAVRKHLLDRLAVDIADAAPLLETFSGHAPVEASEDAVEVPELGALTTWFAAKIGEPVDLGLSVMVGGHSRRMLNAKVTTSSEVLELIVRIEQGGMFGTEGTSEARVMKEVSEAGYPAPNVRWIETDESVLGQPFFVMDRVPGTPVVEDPAVIDTYVAKLHELHQLDPVVATAGLGPVPESGEAAISAMIDHWLGIYRDSVEHRIPLLEECAEWLRVNLRPTGPVVLVHGDPGPGNFLHVDGEITALTDWELAHYGDAAEDWTYFGAIRARRMHDAATWRSIFTEHAGVTFDDEDWLAWEGFNQFKGACVNLTALRIFNEGVITTPNLLAIGTAVHLRFLNRLTEIVGQLR